MDIERLQAMVEEAKSRAGGGNRLIWKPKPGLNTIRPVPYIYDPDLPFVELRVHYNEVSKKPILSPSSPGINKPDPILEFGLRLQEESGGDKETWVRGKKLEPKSRYYLPILVRGKESEGIKFWGFGVQIFDLLNAKIMNPKWGDFTDPVHGRDIDVTYVKPTPQNKFGDTIVDVSPEKTPVTDSMEVLEKMKEMPKVESLFPLHTYEELEKILAEYIAKGSANVTTSSTSTEDTNVKQTNDSGYQSVTAQQSNTESTATTTTGPTASSDDLQNAFKDMFKQKSE